MLSGSDWYQDEARLMVELQRSNRGAARLLAIDGYDNIRELRRGGQGIVFCGTQRSTRRRVAIKVLLDGAFASPTARRRFEREIELVAALRHPNIVQVYDSGVTDDGRLYCVMEYIDGVPLDEMIPIFTLGRGGDGRTTRLRSSPTAAATDRARIRAALALFVKICDAMNAAHLRGIIHRDLKPSNIRVDPQGEPHVLDFGLAKESPAATAGNGDTRFARDAMTASGEFMGSLPWASPEQAETRHETIDIRTDVYSLGVMLYQLLTGNFPYDVHGRLEDVLRHIARSDPANPRSFRPGIDGEVETIVLKCLAKEPERRYQSAGELARDIRRYLAGEPIEARRDSAWYVLRKNLRRFKAAVAVAAAFVVLAVAFAVTMFVLYQRATDAEAQAAKRLVEVNAAHEAEKTARERAEDEAAKARQTYDVLVRMISSADPKQAQGRELTVRELLDQAARTAATDLAGQPELEAALRQVLGGTYLSLGALPEAAAQLDAAAEIRTRVLGPEHPDTLDALDDQAHCRHARGDAAGAAEQLRDVLDARRRVLGPDAPPTLETTNNLGVTLLAASPAEAVELLQGALEGRTRVLGPSHEDTLVTAGNLAVALKTLGRLDEAEALYRGAYEGMAAAHGPDHPATINALGNLASFLDARGQPAEAERLDREVLERRQRVLGPEHPATLHAMSNLALALGERGADAEAEALFRAALAVALRTLGAEARETLVLMNNLAHFLQWNGRPGEAAPLFEQVVETRLRVLGDEHADTLLSRANLAALYSAQGRTFEAERLLRETLEIQRCVLGPQHLSTLITLNNLAHEIAARGDLAAAEPLQREVVEAAEATLTAEHWITAGFRGNWGATLTKLGRYDEAEAQLQAALEVLRRVLGDAHDRTRGVATRLVELYEEIGAFDAADRHRALLGS